VADMLLVSPINCLKHSTCCQPGRPTPGCVFVLSGLVYSATCQMLYEAFVYMLRSSCCGCWLLDSAAAVAAGCLTCF
jgi:hypothetical protein